MTGELEEDELEAVGSSAAVPVAVAVGPVGGLFELGMGEEEAALVLRAWTISREPFRSSPASWSICCRATPRALSSSLVGSW